jgi:hypothetical protein
MMFYKVYFIDLTGYKPPEDIVDSFNHSTFRGKLYEENTQMLIASLGDIERSPLWSFTKKVINEYIHLVY